MKKIIKEFKEEGIVRVTVADERWYLDGTQEVPSVTWVAGCYPKGIAFYKWLADKGWDEAESIKQAAGDKGSKVHQAIEDALLGKEVMMDAKYPNNDGEEEELTLEEYTCLVSFKDWFNEVQPKTIKTEFVVFNKTDNYAGTVDYLCKIGDETWLIDFKTSQSVWTEYELQVSAYRKALEIKGQKIDKVGILQVGYRLNKRGWKMNEIEDRYDLFLHAKAIWQNEHGDEKPKVKDYPTSIKL